MELYIYNYFQLMAINQYAKGFGIYKLASLKSFCI